MNIGTLVPSLLRIEDLARLVSLRIELQFWFTKDRALPAPKIVPINHGRRGETCEGIKGLGLVAFAPESAGCPDARQLNITNLLALQIKNANGAFGVLHVGGDKLMVHHTGVLQGVLRFGISSFQFSRCGFDVSIAITLPRGAFKSVRNQKTGPSLSMNP